MHGERIMAFGLVLPGEGILALFLLPEYLEHGALIDEIKAIIDRLKGQALAMDLHLVHEGIGLSKEQRHG